MAIIEEVPDEAQYPFDRASRAAAAAAAPSTTTTDSDEPQLSLPLRIRRQLHTLPFLSSPALILTTLFFLFSLHISSLLLFTRGFLLTRTTLPHQNTCSPLSPISQQFTDASCSLPATHQKLVLIIIDALRADFILPADETSPSLSSFYSNVLTLPSELTSTRASHSFLSHFIADAPTTTLQRLKGLTTGSLPTFVDAGSNFAGERVGEDNWLSQAKRAGKKISMIGDETWLNVFPKGVRAEEGASVWSEGGVWPFDSFNVEDLDTVDYGVKEHLLPLLERKEDWDIVVAHTLGLDHVGHRFGPDHVEATRKLKEAQELLKDVVERIEEDTLLVVMGDHGMTDRGDHGGDSREEVDAGLWIYSKGPALIDSTWFDHPTTSTKHPLHILFNSSLDATDLGDRLALSWPTKGLTTSTRSVSQVDLVSTLSLLLGLPIPFGNLGLPIPELFYHESSLPIAPIPASASASQPTPTPATKRGFFSYGSTTPDSPPTHDLLTPLATLLQSHLLTSSQLAQYLSTYTTTSSTSSSGSDLLPFMPELHFTLSLAQSAFRAAHAPGHDKPTMETRSIEKFWRYERRAREVARSVWARFDRGLMGSGVALGVGAVVSGVRIGAAAGRGRTARILVGRGVEGVVVTAWGMTALWLLGAFELVGGLKRLGVVGLLAGGGELGVLLAPISTSTFGETFGLAPSTTTTFGWTTLLQAILPILPLLVHAATFASNSFTIHEDTIVLYLITSLLLITLLRSLAAPEQRLRRRLIGFTLVALFAVRLISASTICREEQAPHCHVTFHQPAGSISALGFIGLSYLVAWFVPTLLRRSLAQSASDVGLAPLYLDVVIRTLLLSSTSYWAVDWIIAGLELGNEGAAIATLIKTTFARIVLVGGTLTASLVWYYSPLCLRIEREQIKDKAGTVLSHQVKFTGFANAFASSYLLFFATIFIILHLVSPPIGQLVLSLHLVVLFSLLEIFDSERDVTHLHNMMTSVSSLESLLNGEQPTSPPHSGPTFLQLSLLALLSHLSFFATGHQASFSTIQWSTAFIGFPTLTYPFSPLLVLLNTLSSPLLTTFALPLFIFWNLPPTLTTQNQPPLPIIRSLLRTIFNYSTYQFIIALSSATFASHFRRHLFVWKVFAPRFMLSVIQVGAMDLALLVGFGWGALGVVGKVKNTFKTEVSE